MAVKLNTSGSVFVSGQIVTARMNMFSIGSLQLLSDHPQIHTPAGKGICHTGVNFSAKLTITGLWTHLFHELKMKKEHQTMDRVNVTTHHTRSTQDRCRSPMYRTP